jgi:LDH2 family malate/lactate/ureidoglycolate dehydrogenase
MAITSTQAQPTIQHTELRDLIIRLFSAAGLSDEDAREVGDHLVTADLRGVFTHGSDFAPLYLDRLANGVDAHGRPRIIRDSTAGILVDAGNALGHISGAFAMRLAVERAAETAVAAVAVRGSNHCGVMAYYPLLALERDMIGLATTNAMADMPPWGGIEPLLGSCPLAVGVPAGRTRPLVLDVAFQATNPLKIMLKQELGEPLPDDWAVGADGAPTTDPELALQGWGAPVGRYRGVGLAIIFGALGALLPGASFGWQLGNQLTGPTPGADGHFFLAIDVAAFDDVAAFKERVDTVVQKLKSSPRAPGVDRILMPGERAFETEERYRRDGIPLRASTRRKLLAAAERLGVDPAPLV